MNDSPILWRTRHSIYKEKRQKSKQTLLGNSEGLAKLLHFVTSPIFATQTILLILWQKFQ
jgi:hypothetical protein